MLKHYLIFLLFFPLAILGQNTCPNSNFSDNNFNNWVGYTGYFSNPTSTQGIVNGRHTIITTPGTDPNTCGGLQMIPPGETQSCRLGNSSSGSEAEVLSYTIPVTAQNSLFIYKYAVVLEDPGHFPTEQPSFNVKILDNNGNQIDPSCGVYDVYSGQSGQNFQYCGAVSWLDWKTVGLNLTPYIGTNIKIEFTTKDCDLGGHFGYAYILAKCSTLKANVTVCTGSSTFTLTAPTGFSGYSWSFNGTTLGNTQSITLPLASYNVGDTFDCLLTAYSNGNTCTANVQAALTSATVITPNFSITPNCGNNYVNGSILNFNDLSTIVNGNFGQWVWDFGDGTTSTLQNPTHIYASPGNYLVTLNVISESGCNKIYTKNITITPNSIPTPQINANISICSVPSPTLASITPIGQNWNWYSSSSSVAPLNLSTSLINGTTYYCANIIGGCSSPRVPVTVTVVTATNAQIRYVNTTLCNSSSTIENVVLTGSGFYQGGNYSSSPAGLSINSNTGAINPRLSQGGNYIITYTTLQNGACASVSTQTNITIIDVPTASISYSATSYCTSEIQLQNVTLTGSGNNYNTGTFSSTPPGLSLNTSNGDIDPKTSQPGNYVVTYKIPNQGICVTIPANFNVTILETLPPTGSNKQEFCKINDPRISDLVLTGNNIQWYTSSTGGTPLNVSTLLNNQTYYASQTNPLTNCESLNRFAVEVKVIDVDYDLMNDYTDDFCSEINPNLTNLTIHTNNIVYYPSLTSTVQLPASTPLVNGQVYYAAMIDPVSKCESTRRTAIKVEIVPCDLKVYELITINNNSLNDYLAIKNVEFFEDNDLEIYNRFGQLVFKTSGYGHHGNLFYGEANSGDFVDKKVLPTGTYYYNFKYRKSSLDIDTTKKGFIYILNNNE